MTWVFLIINMLILGVAARVGWRSRKLGRRGFYATILAGAALLLLRSLLHLRPEYEQYLLAISPDYIYFAGWGGAISVMLIFALAGRLPRWQMRRLAASTMIVLMPVFMWSTVMTCTVPEYSMPARFDGDQVCRQTTDFSCGPAAALTVLKRFGRELSEGEMARLCLLRPNEGVTVLELCRGLNLALGDATHYAQIERRSIDELSRETTPFLVELRRSDAVEHCVAVLGVTRDVVTIGDPAYGKRVMGRSEFQSQWTGLIIAVRSTTPTAITRLPLSTTLR